MDGCDGMERRAWFSYVSDGYDHDVCRCVRVGGIDTLGFFYDISIASNKQHSSLLVLLP